MTTPTNSHKAWTNEGGHVNVSSLLTRVMAVVAETAAKAVLATYRTA